MVISGKQSWEYGKALSFDGVAHWVEVPDAPSLRFGTGSCTLEARVWIASWEGQPVVEGHYPFIYKGSPGYYRLNIIKATHEANLYLYGPPLSNSGGTGTDSLQLDTWYHIVGVRDSVEAKVKVYLEGALANQGNDVSGAVNPAGALGIARGWGWSWFPGRIDEVRIYNRALSPGEIWNNYLSMRPVNASGLVLWLKMDEPDTEQVIDYSGQGNHGALKPSYPDNCPARVQGLVPAW